MHTVFWLVGKLHRRRPDMRSRCRWENTDMRLCVCPSQSQKLIRCS